MRRISTLVAAALCWPLASEPAWAHAMLEEAVPAVGSTVANAPREIRLKFSQGVEAALCRVTVTGSAGVVSTGRPHAGGDKSVLIVAFSRSLKPGIYKVVWRAVSVDTHHTEGSFSFTVGR